MKMSNLLRIKARNLCYELFPNFCDSLEALARFERYRKITKQSGFLLPFPPHIKRSILHRHIIDHRCTTLVETGTQYGDTPWYFRNILQEIHTIELSPILAKLARRRFASFPHIFVTEGDSGEKLKEIIPRLKTTTLFWLDGHYSAGVTARGVLDCPIFYELTSIFETCPVNFVILIDDARCFGRDKDYPTLTDLADFLDHKLPGTKFHVFNDIITIVTAKCNSSTL